jgi:nucleoid DNA-binding protein
MVYLQPICVPPTRHAPVMPSHTPSQLSAALAEIVRDALSRGQDMHLPGLGTLRVEHQASRLDELEDGSVVMRPPEDVVVFSAES